MINTLKKVLFSNKLMAVLLILFTISIGVATFVESIYSTAASKKVIYNTHWFELIIFLLGINLIGNIQKYKLWKKEKWSVFIFHVAWIIIVIGAGVTRYVGFEGSMRIRQDQSVDQMISQRTFMQFRLDNGVKQLKVDKPVLFNDLYNSAFDYDLNFEGKEVNIQYLDFVPNAIDSVVTVENGEDVIELVTVGDNGRQSVYLSAGDTKMFGPYPVSFNSEDQSTMAIKINTAGEELTVMSPYDIEYMKMSDQSTGVIAKDSLQTFERKRLLTIGKTNIVYKGWYKSSELQKVTTEDEKKPGQDCLKIAISSGDEKKTVYLPGGSGYVSNSKRFKINGMNFTGSYGAKFYKLPFALKLRKFELESYPGTSSPSSFASEVTLVDTEKSLEEDHRIFMNNVLDHRGYRFFQSSYDEDLKGTVLSVNNDFWGTNITYLGYALMAFGMIFTFVAKRTRFNSLRTKLKKLKTKRLKRWAAASAIFLCFSVQAQTTDRVDVPLDHANKFEKLIVQGRDGRFMPLQTYASELARKITVSKMHKGLTPSQLILGMMYDRAYWQDYKFIKLDHQLLAEELNAASVKVGMSTKYFVSFSQLFNESGYVLKEKSEKISATPDGKRSKYDNDVLKLTERVNICYFIFHDGEILKLFPNPLDPEGAWSGSAEFENFQDSAQLFVKHIVPLYMNGIDESVKSNNWESGDRMLKHISDFQQKFGHHVIPEDKMLDMEMKYNDYLFFNRSMVIYLLCGFVLLILSLIEIFKRNKFLMILQWLVIGILGFTFVFHGVGLAMRWYISGHAPWSNAYEALTFIAWGTILAGLLFVKSSKITMSATAILAGLTLFVAWLDWLNPAITNLEPVLKSYWLTIHVAIITSSYSFLGLGAILGITNMLLMIARNKKNKDELGDSIDELTYISEMTITIGTFAAAIGTFLGGVWANESWGRYWGWDPKETWALVIVLTYTVVLHLRLIPGMKGKYIFNISSILSYGTVLMTFFGVNYYLAGLHSYAGGSSPPLPAFVIPTLVILIIICVWAGIRHHDLNADRSFFKKMFNPKGAETNKG